MSDNIDLTPEKVALILRCSVDSATMLMRDGRIRCIDVSHGGERRHYRTCMAWINEFKSRGQSRGNSLPGPAHGSRPSPVKGLEYAG